MVNLSLTLQTCLESDTCLEVSEVCLLCFRRRTIQTHLHECHCKMQSVVEPAAALQHRLRNSEEPPQTVPRCAVSEMMEFPLPNIGANSRTRKRYQHAFRYPEPFKDRRRRLGLFRRVHGCKSDLIYYIIVWAGITLFPHFLH